MTLDRPDHPGRCWLARLTDPDLWNLLRIPSCGDATTRESGTQGPSQSLVYQLHTAPPGPYVRYEPPVPSRAMASALTVIQIPRDVLDMVTSKDDWEILKLYAQFGGVPKPLSPDHFALCVALARRCIEKRPTFDAELFLRQLYTAINETRNATPPPRPAPALPAPASNNIPSNLKKHAPILAEIVAEVSDLVTENERLAGENVRLVTQNDHVVAESQHILNENKRLNAANRRVVEENRQLKCVVNAVIKKEADDELSIHEATALFP